MKVAIVHDYLNQYGGAERVLEVFCEMFPDAPIYTLFYDEEKTKGRFKGRKVITSFLGKGITKKFFSGLDHFFFWLLPKAIESFRLEGYDMVLISSSSYAKGVRLPANSVSVLYCHTPTRYLWENPKKYVTGWLGTKPILSVAENFLRPVRFWDWQAAQKPQWVLANSSFIAEKFLNIYNRPVHYIFPPPVDTAKFYISEKKDYFLAVGRLLGYKRFDISIQACNKLKLPLKVVGEGRELARLKKIAGPTIEFLGWVDDPKLAELYSGARALLFPQEEDFGLTAVEALASGTPVIAYHAGGILDIVEDGKNGILFDEQNVDSMAGSIEKFNAGKFSPERIRRSVLKFDKEKFKKKFLEFIEEKL